MKKILCCICLFFLAGDSFSQGISFSSGIYGGVGLAASSNYDFGATVGLYFIKAIQKGEGVGINIFMQNYSLYYDKEANSAKHGLGYSGATLRHKSKYVFACPQLVHDIYYKMNFTLIGYVNAGIGYNMGGYDTLHKWDHSYSMGSGGYYDSMIDASVNINKMVWRVELGFTQLLYHRSGWWFTVSEDFGFLPGSLTKTADISNDNPSRNTYSPKKLNPAYISLHLGLMRPKYIRRR